MSPAGSGTGSSRASATPRYGGAFSRRLLRLLRRGPRFAGTAARERRDQLHGVEQRAPTETLQLLSVVLGDEIHRASHLEIKRNLRERGERSIHTRREHAAIAKARSARDAAGGAQGRSPELRGERRIALFQRLDQTMHRQRELVACLERIQVFVG